MTPGAVIFDCDGVIVDSEYPTFVLLAREFADYGLILTPDQIARDFTGGTMAGVADLARTKGAGLPRDWVPRFTISYMHIWRLARLWYRAFWMFWTIWMPAPFPMRWDRTDRIARCR